MKILIASDSHSDYASLDRLYQIHPDMDLYIHAGDSEQDEFSIKPFISVQGNCDHYYDFQEYLLIPSPAGNIYVQHYPQVSKSIINKHDVKIVIHGHTHTRRHEVINGILYVNPGAISYARDKYNGSYAILKIEDNKVEVKFYTLE